jgi:NAD(P)-dependent dehydrogenase (short-subunit alcohol dehydrogenase family)
MSWVENKRVVITGATSGIGKEVAERLGALGGHVVLACRDRARGEQVAGAINSRVGEERATVMRVDMADQRSIAAFAGRYRETHGSLDLLVNNAGVLLPDRATSVDGVELTFATNVVGYHLLTTELLDALVDGERSRVVNVASTFAFDVDLEDLQFERRPYDGMSAYAQSKACDRMLSWALARRLDPASVTVNAVAPGLVLGTELYRHLSADAKRELEQYGSRGVAEGADAVVRVASSDELDGVTGRFFDQGADVACPFRDEAAEEALWEACEQLVGKVGARHGGGR